jgi:hypothetical protein
MIKMLSFILLVGAIWFVFSMWLTFQLAGANDTMGKEPSVPMGLTVAWTVALFPADLLHLEGTPPAFLGDAAGIFFFIIVAVNSLLWAAAWAFLISHFMPGLLSRRQQ